MSEARVTTPATKNTSAQADPQGNRLVPVTDPAPVAHRPLAVAAVDVKRCRRLVQAGDGAARAQLDDLIRHVPQLESL